MVFLVFLLLYSNFFTPDTSIFNINPFFQAKITELSSQNANTLIIYFPYLVIIGLVLYAVLRTARQLDHGVYRRTFRIALLGIAVIILFLSGSNPNVSNKGLPFLSAVFSSSSSTSTSTSTSSSTSQVPVHNYSSVTPIGNFDAFNIILLLLVLAGFVLIFLVSRIVLNPIKKNIIMKSDNKQTMERYDPLKSNIIAEYLKLSEILESKGINPDYSLTPVEFDAETQTNFVLKEFELITYYYEMARFSSTDISDHEYSIFQENLEKIYTAINKLKEIKSQDIDRPKV